MRKFSKIIKNKCEIDTCSETENLHLHHIIERTDVNTSNDPMNLAILCPNHHSACHSGSIKLIGLYPSTLLPNGRTLIYEVNGVNEFDIHQPYIEFKAKSFKLNIQEEENNGDKN